MEARILIALGLIGGLVLIGAVASAILLHRRRRRRLRLRGIKTHGH